jgi:putative protease
MIEHLGELRAAGIDAIKLEGRSKGAYYTAAVTNAYRHVLDGEDATPWRRELDLVSHRPYSTGFYLGKPEFCSVTEHVSPCLPCSKGFSFVKYL